MKNRHALENGFPGPKIKKTAAKKPWTYNLYRSMQERERSRATTLWSIPHKQETAVSTSYSLFLLPASFLFPSNGPCALHAVRFQLLLEGITVTPHTLPALDWLKRRGAAGGSYF